MAAAWSIAAVSWAWVPGPGSAFALLPPPKRLRQLDQDRAARAGAHRARSGGPQAHPLRIGLSVTADVDISDQAGLAITNAPAAAEMRVDSDDTVLAEADEMIRAPSLRPTGRLREPEPGAGRFRRCRRNDPARRCAAASYDHGAGDWRWAPFCECRLLDTTIANVALPYQ